MHHRTDKTKPGAFGAVGLLLLSLGACGATVVAEAQPAASKSTTAQTASSPPPPPDSDSPAPLSEATRRAIAEFGTDITVVDVAREKPAVDQEAAAKVASAEFGMVNGRRPSEMALARVTNEGTKNFLESDLPPGGPDRSRILDNRLAWVVVYDGVTIPNYGGGAPVPGCGKKPVVPMEPFGDSFMVLVDATTGKYISGESVIRQHPVAKNPG